MNFSEFYSNRIIEFITKYSNKKENQIFVILGQTELLNTNDIADEIADIEKFTLNGNIELFNKDWFTKIFNILNEPKRFHLLSFAQFSYLIEYIPGFFNERIIILRDNLRQIFPINRDEYLENISDDNIEERPHNIPIYQTEQIQINNYFFYSVKYLNDDFPVIDLFNDTKPLNFKKADDLVSENINISSDPTGLDFFLNKCIIENNLSKKATIKTYTKQKINDYINQNIEKINFLLGHFGGELFLIKEDIVEGEYTNNEEISQLFSQYWGDNSNFRSLKVYRDPNMGNEISEISQGLIVETIINEYKKSKQGETPRDLFLTAPTGAGKSLLFQLPAFYVSQLGDITIVVSPLIALMKDQVSAIINDRNFTKVAYLNSEINLIDRENIIENCKNGNIDILYMAPELLLSYHISHFIGERNLGLVVIDEAHLITTWGRDFRVDYWFLGNHINKIRKYENLKFPMVAVTATAVYGGENDMVFDSIDNLSMQNPHIFIGQVKRDDITFVINNYENFKKDYEKNKLNQTVDFIKSVNEIGLKTLIYAPYTKHIEDIIRNLRRDNLDIATGYYGSLPPEHKELAFRLFSSGDKKVMIATKAFGMGVDISDIELVYHHAPSGLLPDYIQEIGRVARRNDIKGFAALNYSTQDQRFTKVLHGMSSIKKWQIQEVLKKIYNLHIKNKENRNLLISSEDFGAIFENTKQSSIDQKVLTALMMIEKDYLAKYRFNVLIARPKKLFTKCYAKINDNGFTIYKNRYPNTYTYISNDNGHHIIEINLDKLWNKSFRDQNFAIVKKLFYEKKLLNNINLIPLLKISFKLEDLFNNIYNRIQSTFNNIANIFIGFNGRYFNQIEFEKKLNSFINNEFKAKKLAEFILSSYSGILIRPGVIEGNAFLQKRRTGDDFTYRVFNQRYLYRFNQIIERFNILFNNNNNTIAERFITKIENNTINYIRLGCLLEIMEYGTFEVKGGDNPMIFIRINDPKKLRKDAYSNDYNNTLLSSTLNRYSTSNQIFDHFFLRDFSNEERWNFIEDFFLGTDIDELLSNHRGREQKNNLDIINFLTENKQTIEIEDNSINQNDNIHIHPPIQNKFYELSRLLTIGQEGNQKTMRVSEWLKNDPVILHKTLKKYNIKIPKSDFILLISKLRNNHFEYYRDFMRLKLKIKFGGYENDVEAIVPYKDKPIDFYKWWCKDKTRVKMSTPEKVQLFDKVHNINSSILTSEDKKFIGK